MAGSGYYHLEAELAGLASEVGLLRTELINRSFDRDDIQGRLFSLEANITKLAAMVDRLTGWVEEIVTDTEQRGN